MGDANDFTFAQPRNQASILTRWPQFMNEVGPQQDEDLLESPKSIPNISAIAIDGNNSTDTTFNKNNNSSVKYSSLDRAKFKSSTIIDLLSPKFKASGSLEKVSIRDSVNGSQEPKIAVRKPAVRVKVPFEKGYSQMNWLKLTQTDPDLAGLKGQSNRRLISMDEVKQHKTEGSIWTVLKGHVYNISPYMKFHPGGVDMLMKAAGRDCTSLFNKYHAWVNAEFLLEKCLVGILDDSR